MLKGAFTLLLSLAVAPIPVREPAPPSEEAEEFRGRCLGLACPGPPRQIVGFGTAVGAGYPQALSLVLKGRLFLTGGAADVSARWQALTLSAEPGVLGGRASLGYEAALFHLGSCVIGGRLSASAFHAWLGRQSGRRGDLFLGPDLEVCVAGLTFRGGALFNASDPEPAWLPALGVAVGW